VSRFAKAWLAFGHYTVFKPQFPSAHEQHRSYARSICEDAQRKLRRLVHSNALFTATDYGCEVGHRHSTSAPLTGAWVAYACNDTCNPGMLVHECNVPMYSDRTRLSVELDTDDAAYGLPTLQLYGLGSAWFDELQFERV